MTDQAKFLKGKYRKLEDVPTIGNELIEKLRKIGFTTVENLVTADPKELATKTSGISLERAEHLIEEVRKTRRQYIPAQEYRKMLAERVLLTSGCKNLDTLLRGGFRTQSITELYSEWGGGKSQLCHQLAVTVQLPKNEGGLDGGCLYLDTEQVFEPDRCVEMAKMFPSLDPETVCSRIQIAPAYTSKHQVLLLNHADEVIKDNNVKLIVVDSLTSHFRSEYLGREMLSPRQQNLNRHMHKLKNLAVAFNAVAIVTNQVIATPTEYAGYEPTAIGGNIVGHQAHTRLYLKKGRGSTRIVRVVASPFLPEGETPVFITDAGIVGNLMEAE